MLAVLALAASFSAADDVDLDACLALVKQHKQDEARDCYAKHGAADAADVVGSLRLREPKELAKPDVIDLGVLVRDGKAEMIGVSTLAGGYVAFLGVETLVVASNTSSSLQATAAVLLAPVAGGVAGLGLGTLAAVQIPQLTAGDANAVRAFIILGAFDSFLVTEDLVASGINPFDQGAQPLVPAAMAGLVVGGAALGVGVAYATDLPEAAGSLALSSALWTTVGTLLVLDMGQAFKGHEENAALWMTAAANVGFAGGLVASPFVPITRAETWAVDVGGGVGLATGASIAVFARAPNPFVGWGTMLLGTGLGVAGGYACAHYVPEAVGALPDVVAVAPLVVENPSTKTVSVGGALTGRF